MSALTFQFKGNINKNLGGRIKYCALPFYVCFNRHIQGGKWRTIISLEVLLWRFVFEWWPDSGKERWNEELADYNAQTN